MIRCYLTHDRIVGFCDQWPTGLLDQPTSDPRRQGRWENADAHALSALRMRAERDRVPAMIQLLGLEPRALPVIWDADFVYGPKGASGEDSYVLCEINVSAVWPFPPQAARAIAGAAAARVLANRNLGVR